MGGRGSNIFLAKKKRQERILTNSKKKKRAGRTGERSKKAREDQRGKTINLRKGTQRGSKRRRGSATGETAANGGGEEKKLENKSTVVDKRDSTEFSKLGKGRGENSEPYLKTRLKIPLQWERRMREERESKVKASVKICEKEKECWKGGWGGALSGSERGKNKGCRRLFMDWSLIRTGRKEKR